MCMRARSPVPTSRGSEVELLSPASLAEAADCVRAARDARAPLEIMGAATKRGFGRPVDAVRQLTTAAMSGILSYHPEELILVARAGTRMAEINAVLAEKGQHLAFEPPDFADLYPGGDVTGAEGTLGGVISCNLSGPRRLVAGAARDHFLGFTAVNGVGEIFKGGGPVVKNVTGYDLPKLMAGAFGTLALMDELTVKTMPRPEKTRTALFYGLDALAANAAMTRALGGTYEVTGAAFLPEVMAQLSDVERVGMKGSVTALRIEGSGPAVAHHCARLRADLGGASDELHSTNSHAFWREVKNATRFLDDDAILWRVSVPPSEGAKIVAGYGIDLQGCNFFLDWGGGLIWLSLPATGGAHAQEVRAALQKSGGHATLVRAPEAERRKVGVFEVEGSRALVARVKQAFDPDCMLNPGRMVEGL